MDEIPVSREVNYALVLKLNMLQRRDLPQLSLKDLRYSVVHGKWRDRIPEHPSEAVEQILALTAEDVVITLTRLALTEGGRMEYEDYAELLGGTENETKSTGSEEKEQ